MLETYQATLQGNYVEWGADIPPQANNKEKVTVFVTILENAQPASDGRAMASALEKIATANSLAEITNPVEWQQEQRQDKALVGRE